MVSAIGDHGFSLVALGLVTVALSGCSDFKKVVGIEKTSPDEFAVESRAPLTIPPDFDLRPPAPGATRPQEVSAANKAKTAIDNAGPGDPGKQAAGTLHYPGTAPDADSQVADQSLAAKLLQSSDTGNSVVVEKRETTPLQGVY
ncbi:MAG TPA: DUF3035 domain-containing protein [Stellaceae bacterium]|nr:DUF3035 domain-containing protein [Stellaceae bacterium]